jgi:hypothetical protein
MKTADHLTQADVSRMAALLPPCVQSPVLVLSTAAMKKFGPTIDLVGPFFVNGEVVKIVEAKRL